MLNYMAQCYRSKSSVRIGGVKEINLPDIESIKRTGSVKCFFIKVNPFRLPAQFLHVVHIESVSAADVKQVSWELLVQVKSFHSFACLSQPYAVFGNLRYFKVEILNEFTKEGFGAFIMSIVLSVSLADLICFRGWI